MQPSKSMLVYLGANANKKLVDQILNLNSDSRFISSHIFPEAPLSLLDDQAYLESLVTFDDAIEFESGEIKFTPIADYNFLPIIDEVMSDKHLPLLWSRFRSKIRQKNSSEVKRYEVVYTFIKSALETCHSLQPELVVFSYEPHMLPIYIFKRVATLLGIKVFTLTISPFVWRVFCEVEEKGKSYLLNEHLYEESEGVKDDSVRRMLNEKQGNYTQAKPFYENRNVKKKSVLGWLNKLKVNGWNPRKAVLCQNAVKEYQRVVTGRNAIKDLKYISLYLQYQPEQTTLPDGKLFVHQLFAIQMLYSAISPLGISLVVREHPATFESTFDPKWRPEDFYSTIIGIGSGIYIDDINEDPFTLIEKSIAVSSINGSVLLEGLLRGKPVISFGKHTLKGFVDDALIDEFNDENELKSKIEKASGIESVDIVSHIENYLYRIYSATYGADIYPGNDAMSFISLRKSRYDALSQIVGQLSQKSGDRL